MKTSKFHQFLILLASFVAQFISEGIVISFTIYYPTLSRYFNTTQAEISLIGSFSYGCWCCIGKSRNPHANQEIAVCSQSIAARRTSSGCPFAGHLVEKFGSTPVLMFAGLFGTLSMFVGAYAVHLWHIIVCFGGLALCCGLALIPSITVITNFFTSHQHIAATAATIGGASGAVCYPLLVQYLLINQTWHYCFVITSGLMLQLVVCSLILNVKSAKHLLKQADLKSVYHSDISTATMLITKEGTCESETLNPRIEMERKICSVNEQMDTKMKINLGLYAVHCFLWNLTCFAFLTVVPLFLDHIGRTVTEIAFLMSICAVAVIVGRCMAALYCIRKNGDRIFCYNSSTLLSGICISLFVLESNFAVYCIFAALYGLFFGLQTAIMVVVTLDIVKNQHVNFSFGIILFACGVAGLISPFITGWLCDILQRFDYVFAIISLPSFLCCFLMTHLHWPFKVIK